MLPFDILTSVCLHRSTMEERLQMATTPEEIKHQIFSHMADVRAERRRAMKIAQDCAAKSGWLFQYDDKCGSNYLHLPMQMRETAASQSRYKYRFGLQGNLVPGVLLKYSYVPPCLHTGTCDMRAHVRMSALGLG